MEYLKRVDWLFFACFFFLFSGCKKKPSTFAAPGTSEITLSISNPIENGVFSTGETIHLDGIADADAILGGWRSTLTNSSTGEIIDTFEQRYEQTQYILHHHWVIESQDTLQLSSLVEVFSVNDELLTSKTVHFQYHP